MVQIQKLPGLLLGPLAALAFCLPAQAAEPFATFEDLTVAGLTTSSLISGNFSFSPSSGSRHAVQNRTDYGASNGTNYLVFQTDQSRSETFSLSGGGYFDLTHIDIGGWFNFSGAAPTLTLSGVTGTGTVSASLTLSSTEFTTFTSSQLVGFTQLQSVTLGNVAGISYVALDNINYVPAIAPPSITPVPEPETYALMLAGLALVGWATRRRVIRA